MYSSALCVALPHLMMEDIIYEGYYIPKGTSVFANIWYVC